MLGHNSYFNIFSQAVHSALQHEAAHQNAQVTIKKRNKVKEIPITPSSTRIESLPHGVQAVEYKSDEEKSPINSSIFHQE